MFINILMTIVIAAIAAVVAVHFTDEKKNVSRIVAECLGVGVGLVALKYLASRFPEFSWLVLIIIVAFIGGLMYQWHRQGSEPAEFACFAALTLIAGGIARIAAANYASATIIPLLIVVLISIFAIGFYGFTALRFHRERNVLDDDERKALLKDKKNDKIKEMDKNAGKFGMWMTAVAIATLIALAGATGIVLGMADSGLFEGAPDGADATIAETVNAADTEVEDTEESIADADKVTNEDGIWAGAHFYNFDLQDDGDDTNDRNFGPNPWKEGSSVDYYVADRQERYHTDPVLLAAKLVSYDRTFGTDYTGEVLYNGYDEKLNSLDLANAVAQVLCTDEELFNKAVDVVDKRQAEAKTELKKLDNITDQFYMEPYTMLDRPELVIYESDVDSAWCLVDTFTLKNGVKVTIIDRIVCGYQECNAAEKFDVTPGTPSKNPPKKDNPPGKGDNPTPTPEKKNMKDQSKRKAIGNDDKGPGENTINPSDPNHSTKDRSDNSTSGSYDDYKKNLDNLNNTNQNQKTGSDSSKPSTPTPSNTNVDNNGGKINTPTPTKEPETVKNDPAAGTMSEPS